MAFAEFNSRLGLDMVHVPYKGGPEAITSVLRGETCCIMNQVQTVLPQWKAGKVRLLGVTTPKRVAVVPEARRQAVRVDPTRPEQRAPGWVYLADLRQHGADGRYPTRAVPAEALAGVVLNMAGHQGALGSPSGSHATVAVQGADAGAPSTSPAVIIYGASWCSACHQAADYLRRRHVAFVEKDIEQDPAAAQEMMDKARRAGVPTGSIPILDVRGRIMAGFSAPAIDAALGG
jgi:glutaredoxin